MKPRLIVMISAALLLIVACFVLFLTAFTVRATECAVVLRWERPIRSFVGTEPGGAGLHWKLPLPIDTVEKFDARTHVFSTKSEETSTQDGYNIIVTVSSGWRIADPVEFRKKVITVEKAQELLKGLVRTYKKAVIGQHPLAHLVSTDPHTLKFDRMEGDMLEKIGREAEEKYGIIVEFVKIKQLALPKSATEAVFQRMRDERESIAVDIRESGQEEAKKIRALANAERDEIIAKASAEAKILMGQGDAEAAKSYEVFAENEDLAIFLRKIDALRKTLAKRATVILTTDNPPYDLLEKGWKEK